MLKDVVPVRGSPAPMTWIWVPGFGTDVVWPIVSWLGG
jgi:hypothetical protein